MESRTRVTPNPSKCQCYCSVRNSRSLVFPGCTADPAPFTLEYPSATLRELCTHRRAALSHIDCDGIDLACPPDPNDVHDAVDGFTENDGDCDGLVDDFNFDIARFPTYYSDSDDCGFVTTEVCVESSVAPVGYTSRQAATPREACPDTHAIKDGMDNDCDARSTSTMV